MVGKKGTVLGAVPFCVIEDMIMTKSGETLVRIYNPFMNREEVYTWDEFAAAWEDTGQNSTYQVVNIFFGEGE